MSDGLKLHRYWIVFDDPRRRALGFDLGCGVTAFDLRDAISLLESHVFKGSLPFPIASTIEDVDIRTLDQGHVIPNMLPPSSRGIWFPLGYSSSVP